MLIFKLMKNVPTLGLFATKRAQQVVPDAVTHLIISASGHLVCNTYGGVGGGGVGDVEVWFRFRSLGVT